MSGTASKRRSPAPEALWAAFAAANAAVMLALEEWQTVPFHLIWISLTILYGFRLWPPRTTALVLTGVSIATGAALLRAALGESGEVDELTEVPLMGAVFLAMVWHARRRQDALAALERSARRERDFARDASHELRTPITVARGHAELLKTERPETGPDVDVVLGELERLQAIADRLVALAAADRRADVGDGLVDVDALVQDAARRWAPTCARDWSCDADAARVVAGDAGRLETALDALVENAIHATSKGDGITIACRAEPGVVVVEVRDSGRGIPPAAIARIFDRFAHFNGTGRGGTGLGLAIVKAVAEAHGGTVGAESSPGAGTVVRLVLPAA